MIYRIDLNPGLMGAPKVSFPVVGSFVNSQIDLYKFGDGCAVPFVVAMDANGIDKAAALWYVAAYFGEDVEIKEVI